MHVSLLDQTKLIWHVTRTIGPNCTLSLVASSLWILAVYRAWLRPLYVQPADPVRRAEMMSVLSRPRRRRFTVGRLLTVWWSTQLSGRYVCCTTTNVRIVHIVLIELDSTGLQTGPVASNPPSSLWVGDQPSPTSDTVSALHFSHNYLMIQAQQFSWHDQSVNPQLLKMWKIALPNPL